MSRRKVAGGFELDDDAERIDLDAVHTFLANEAYWGRGRPQELLDRAIRGSARVVGVYRDDEQVGFGRAISDGATVAYLADVYVLGAYRGRGLGLELVRELVERGPDAELTWLLHTADAQRPLREARLQLRAATLSADGAAPAPARGGGARRK